MDYLTLALKIIETAYQLGQDIGPLLDQVNAANSKDGGPTDDDMAALKAVEDAQSGEIAASLGPG